jgi:hypothetical protein
MLSAIILYKRPDEALRMKPISLKAASFRRNEAVSVKSELFS